MGGLDICTPEYSEWSDVSLRVGDIKAPRDPLCSKVSEICKDWMNNCVFKLQLSRRSDEKVGK
jgi:hypothetical protein